MMDREEKSIGYHDLYFRIIVALLAAHIIVSFGAKESFFVLLISWYYYRSLLLSFVIAFLLVSEVYLVTIKLDKNYNWKERTVQRIGLQLLIGLLLPSVTAFLLATAYFSAFGFNILNTYYIRFDFPVIVIMLVLLNVYYLAFYFYKQWQLLESTLINPANGIKGEKQKGKEVFVVQKGAKNIPLPVDSISYFYHNGAFNFVRTFEKEDFIISQPLDEVQQQLSDKHFFRVNRQMIINFTACQHFEPLEHGKLELIVIPVPKEQVIISQKRAKAFKEWIER
jgi:hypothetical protein